MAYAIVLAILMAISVVVFVDIQLYMVRPEKDKDLEAWFDQFEKYNRDRYRDPDLAWRYYIIERAFHKSGKR